MDVNSTTICMRLVLSLKSDCNLFSRLYVASQFRDVNLNDYFSNEKQPCPPSLSARVKLKLGTKSGIVRCLEDASEQQDDITPSVDVVMLDGPAMLCVLKHAAAGTLHEYACQGCVPTLCGTINWVKKKKKKKKKLYSTPNRQMYKLQYLTYQIYNLSNFVRTYIDIMCINIHRRYKKMININNVLWGR